MIEILFCENIVQELIKFLNSGKHSFGLDMTCEVVSVNINPVGMCVSALGKNGVDFHFNKSELFEEFLEYLDKNSSQV